MIKPLSRMLSVPVGGLIGLSFDNAKNLLNKREINYSVEKHYNLPFSRIFTNFMTIAGKENGRVHSFSSAHKPDFISGHEACLETFYKVYMDDVSFPTFEEIRNINGVISRLDDEDEVYFSFQREATKLELIYKKAGIATSNEFEPIWFGIMNYNLFAESTNES